LKITAVEAVPVSIPYTHGGPPTGFGGTEWTQMEYLLIRIDTDEGLTGWGEAFGYNCIPATKAALEKMVAPLLVGRDPAQIAQINDELQRTLHLFGRYGVTLFAISGVDIALWDLAGKRAGQPLAALLGGAARDSVPAYASLLKYRDADLVAEIAGRAVGDGFTQIKVHETAEPEIAAARRAIGDDIPLMVDVNCVWSPDAALAMAGRLAPYDLHWLEEPVWPPEDFEGLRRVREQAPMPLAAGENACTAFEFLRLLETGAVDIIQPSVTKVGGVTEFVKVLHLASAHNARVAPHSPYFGPGLLATLQILATRPEIEAVEIFHLKLEQDLFGGAVDVRNGRVAIPTGPGLGADPDLDVIARYRA
jgi:L-alanine-DL-glutamate epimerase-like enolase superfamily enzyme